MFAAVSVFAIFACLLFGGVRLGYNISMDGKVITTVSSKNVYYSACEIVAQIVEGDDVLSVLPEIEIEAVVTADDTVNNCDEVVNAIIDNTDEIVWASRLHINGEAYGCAEPEALEAALEARRTAFDIPGAVCKSEFADEVLVEEGYFIKDEVDGISALSESIALIKVKTVVTESRLQSVPYQTVTQKTSEKPAGYVSVSRQGVCGTVEIKTDIIYINGEETDRITTSSKVTAEPVNEIITVGTARTSGASARAVLKFPLPAGVWEISCPFGKGGHKGVDLRAPHGTPIMAAAGGTVTLAGVYRNYGNCVIIDHGNGFSTLYAHASSLCVRQGDKVSAGEVIALVGSTGYSTGNHLHFEVYVGENRVNPQPYIGL